MGVTGMVAGAVEEGAEPEVWVVRLEAEEVLGLVHLCQRFS